jgi:DNA-binding MarR family transcriptional regulator
MKTHNRSMSGKRRKDVVFATRMAGRELSVYGSILYALIAERLGLTMTDLRAWDLLHLHGPVTHGKFTDMIGLSGGAVTALVDRLERLGAVTRERDPNDRRKVILKAVSSVRQGSLKHVFDAMAAGAERVLNQFTNEELEASSRLMLGIGEVMHQEIIKLRTNEPVETAAVPPQSAKRRRQLVAEA